MSTYNPSDPAHVAALEAVNNLSTEELSLIKEKIREAETERVKKFEDVITSLQADKLAFELEKKTGQGISERSAAYHKIEITDRSICHYNNIINALKNGGDIISFTDKKGIEHKEIPSFLSIKTDVISFNEDSILDNPVPVFIPCINESEFKTKGYVFDAIRVESDTYLLCVNGYHEYNKATFDYAKDKASGIASVTTNGYILVTLDQLALINDYYYTKAKAINQKKAKDDTARQEAYYNNLPIEKRRIFIEQKNFYHSLPAAIKKKYTKEVYDVLSFEEKEALYKPFKRYGAKRLVSKLGEHTMWTSFHFMYERFVNPLARRMFKSRPSEVTPVDYTGRDTLANPEAWAYWKNFSEFMEYKLIDIQVQREQESETRKIGEETSFGLSNTNDLLQAEYGILVKRQNGSAINPVEIEQIKKAWVSVQRVIGGISAMAAEDALKISHTAGTYVYASRAVGMYIPMKRTIAVSAKLGDQMFENIMAHEVAHYIDDKIGESLNKRYITDNFESKAGVLARTFRKHLNKKTDSKYTNATKECFARCMEQYFAIAEWGIDAEFWTPKHAAPYTTQEDYVNEKTFTEIIKPMVEEFLLEQQDFFKYLVSEPKEEIGVMEDKSIEESNEYKNSKPAYSKRDFDGFTIERELIEDNKTRISVRKNGQIAGIVYPSVMYPSYVSDDEAIVIWKREFEYPIPNLISITGKFISEHVFDKVYIGKPDSNPDKEWKKCPDYSFTIGAYHISVKPNRYGANIGLYKPRLDVGNVPSAGNIKDWETTNEAEYVQYLNEALDLLNKELLIDQSIEREKQQENTLDDCLRRNGINLEEDHHRFEIGTVISSNGINYSVTAIDGEKVTMQRVKFFQDEPDVIINSTFDELIERFKNLQIYIEGFKDNDLKPFARILHTIAICYKISELEIGSARAKDLENELYLLKNIPAIELEIPVTVNELQDSSDLLEALQLIEDKDQDTIDLIEVLHIVLNN